MEKQVIRLQVITAIIH